MILALPLTRELFPVAIDWLTIELASDFLKGCVVNGRRPATRATNPCGGQFARTSGRNRRNGGRADSAMFLSHYP